MSINAGNEIASYSVFLNGGTNENGVDNTDLVNPIADSLPSAGSLATSIPSMAWSGDFTINSGLPMHGNAWGVALPDSYPSLYNDKATYESLITNPASSSNGPMYTFSGIPPLSYGQPNGNNPIMNKMINEATVSTSTDVYYGVKIDNPSTMLAGDYTADVVYTVIAELKVPSITSISPNPIRTGTSNRITLEGNNLSIVNKVTIDDRGTIRDCTNITHSGTNSDTVLTCTLPAISNTGTYVITAETEGGQTATANIQVRPPAPIITSVSPFTTEIGSSGTILTIGGESFINVQYVYVDFNGNGELDGGEQCQSLIVTSDARLSCTAPGYSVTGVYDLIVVAAGGTSYPWRYSYVEPETTVTRVEPSVVYTSQYMENVVFSIYGSNLSNCRQVELSDNYGNNAYCHVRSAGVSSIECIVQWIFKDAGSISATLYDNAGEIMYEIKMFTQNSR